MTIPHHQERGTRAALEAFRLGEPMQLQLPERGIVDIRIQGMEWTEEGLLLNFLADMPDD